MNLLNIVSDPSSSVIYSRHEPLLATGGQADPGNTRAQVLDKTHSEEEDDVEALLAI